MVRCYRATPSCREGAICSRYAVDQERLRNYSGAVDHDGSPSAGTSLRWVCRAHRLALTIRSDIVARVRSAAMRLVCLVALPLVALLAGCGGSSKDGGGGSESAQGQLGIEALAITPADHDVAKTVGRKLPDSGVLVLRFRTGSPAKAAGITDYSANRNSVTDSDAIETVDGKPATPELVAGPMPGRKAGDTVTLHVWAPDGTERDVRVKLAEVKQPDVGPFVGG